MTGSLYYVRICCQEKACRIFTRSEGQEMRDASTPKSWAAVFARLASIDGDGLTAAEEKRLLAALTHLVTAGKKGGDPRWASQALRQFFPLIHNRARQWIGGLLDGDLPVTPEANLIGRVTWTFDREREIVKDVWPDAGESLLGELVALIHQRPFPFRRCTHCGNIFVRSGKRTYCTQRCAGGYKRENDAKTGAERARRSRRKVREKRKRVRLERERVEVARIRAGGSLVKHR
jgi:hypothetical protein